MFRPRGACECSTASFVQIQEKIVDEACKHLRGGEMVDYYALTNKSKSPQQAKQKTRIAVPRLGPEFILENLITDLLRIGSIVVRLVSEKRTS